MSTHISVPPQLLLERILTLEIVRVTERAAVSAARLRGHGQEKAADQAAVDAMRRELNKLPIDGTVVIGEGERDEAPMLFIGENVGTKLGPKVDIAVDALEGTTLCAKNMPGAIATMAMAEGGTLLNAPDVYMEKIAIGPGYPEGTVSLEKSVTDNIRALAAAKKVQPNEIIAWQSIEGSDVYHRGSVRFREAPGGRGTEIHVRLRYDPPAGRLGAAVAKLFHREPGQEIADDLRGFKQVMETGEVVQSDARRFP